MRPSAPDVFAPGHLGELTQVVPFEMVDAALEAGGGVQRRVRRLPSRVVVYLLLAGALFGSVGWSGVWSRLCAGLGRPVEPVSASSISQAMRRVGPAPLKALFDLLSGPLPVQGGADRFASRRVVALDGTLIAVADTEANRAAFPKSRSGRGSGAGYPMIRLVTLLAASTRSLLAAAVDSDRVGETSLAAGLIRAMGPGMLVLADRGLASTGMWTLIRSAGSDFLTRVRTGTSALRLDVERVLPDGSWLSNARGTRVRVIDARIALTTTGPERTGHWRLVTSLTDHRRAPADQLVRLYHERWEIETAYCELKSALGAGRVLRARHPRGVLQEVWALLCAYQALRTAMADAVPTGPGTDPDRASFTVALNAARDQIVLAQHITADRPDLTGPIGTAVLAALLPPRRPRTRTRAIKRALSKHRARTLHPDRTTYPVTITTHILTPHPDP